MLKIMKEKSKNVHLAACFGVASAFMSGAANAGDFAPSGGFGYVYFQGAGQLSALVQFFLILAFAVGVIFIVIAGIKIPKLAKQQLPDDEKKDVFIKMGAGAALILIPLIIAVATGVLGGDENSAAEVVRDAGIEWGL